MLDVWSWLHGVLAATPPAEISLPAAVTGVLLGVVLGLALPLALLGVVSLLVWGLQHGRHTT